VSLPSKNGNILPWLLAIDALRRTRLAMAIPIVMKG
jgi:hypothetical protein